MKIETKKYQGYLWYSDQNEPQLLLGNEPWGIEKSETENPFIVEGQLWDEDSRTSVSIKYADGHYIVSTCQLEGEYDLVEYVPRNMPTVSRLLFARCWKPVPDANCNQLPVLTLDRTLFKGLKMKEDRL